MQTITKKKEIQYISFLQFIGPIFVILGHSLNGMSIETGPWWMLTKDWIYIFHMPLFFMVSGYLLSHSDWMKGNSYGNFIKKKFLRLIVPYLFWNILFFVPKLLLQSFLADSVEMSASYIIRIYLSPRQNIWGHTWFLVGLFLVYLLTPLWEKLFTIFKGKNVIWIFAIGTFLYILPIGTEFLCLNDLHKDLLFFWLGCNLGMLPYERLSKMVKDRCALLGVLSVVTSAAALLVDDITWFNFIPCTCILLFLLSIGMNLEGKLGGIFALARNSFGIYIMHWPVMLCCRVLLYQILGLNRVLTIIIMVILGYLVPNVVVWMLRKIKLGKLNIVLKYLVGV